MEPPDRSGAVRVEPASRSRIATGVALAVGSAAFLALAAALPLTVIAHQFLSALPILAACAPFAAVGCLVAYRQQRNPVGWLMLALGSGSLIGLDAVAYSILRYRQGHTGLPLGPVAAFVTPVEWVSVLLLLPLPVLLFPEGRLPKAWRRWMWCYVALACVWLVGLSGLDVEGLVRPLNIDSSGSFAVVDNPPVGWERFATNGFIVIVWGVLALGAFARQLLAFRGSTGVRRGQQKWLLAGGAVCFLGLLAALTTGGNATGFEAIIGATGLTAVAALPVGFGIGILQYRLYDIDRIISRTISYTIVTGLLVGVFVGLVLLATRALPFSSPVGVAAATLAAAALFNPLRRKTQRLVDRRFNRAGYDAEATVAAFGARLRHAIDVDAVLAELSTAAARSLEPAHVTVWVRSDPGTAPL
jgi:hypothetical protein